MKWEFFCFSTAMKFEIFNFIHSKFHFFVDEKDFEY